MKEFYDYMRFPVRGSNDFWQVIRAGYRKYDVYLLNVEMFPDVVSISHYLIDLNQYTDEDLAEYVATWGYKSLDAFIDYLENKTQVQNHELRLCTCIIENNEFLEPEIVFEGDLENASSYISNITPSAENSEDHDRLHC